MHAIHATTERTESPEQPLETLPEFDLQALLDDVNRYARAHAESRPAAVVCGASGCRTREYLAHLSIDGFGKRVVCPTHLVELVNRELEQPGPEAL